MQKAARLAWVGLMIVLLWFSLGPLVGLLSGPRYWPGFFYAPFYTTNIFTDLQTPAYRVGLRPEDRVIGANRERIDRLAVLTARQGASGDALVLIYELGREAASIRVPVEPLGWERILEKWGPLVGAGLGLAGLAWRGRWVAGPSGVALLAAVDYWLNPGAGRESGFDPAGWAGLEQAVLLATAKWSTYFYWPLWTLAWATLLWWLAHQLAVGRSRRLFYALSVALGCAELGAYTYEAVKTATYNNPDYITFHARAIFWFGWGSLLALAAIRLWQVRRKWQSWAGFGGLSLFVVGWAGPTTFDSVWPGPGPQWYTWGLVAFVWFTPKKAPALLPA